jgi:hypothetical protein
VSCASGYGRAELHKRHWQKEPTRGAADADDDATNKIRGQPDERRRRKRPALWAVGARVRRVDAEPEVVFNGVIEEMGIDDSVFEIGPQGRRVLSTRNLICKVLCSM